MVFYLTKPGKTALITIVTNLKLKMKFNRVYKLSLKGLNLIFKNCFAKGKVAGNYRFNLIITRNKMTACSAGYLLMKVKVSCFKYVSKGHKIDLFLLTLQFLIEKLYISYLAFCNL